MHTGRSLAVAYAPSPTRLTLSPVRPSRVNSTAVPPKSASTTPRAPSARRAATPLSLAREAGRHRQSPTSAPSQVYRVGPELKNTEIG
jgi:hypothetical protein